MNRMYLVQRCVFNDLTETKHLFGRDEGLLELDYMGSAEFEFGAVPRSWGRLMEAYPKNHNTIIKTDIMNPNGVPLWIYMKNPDQYNEALRVIRRYIECNSETHKICDYRLKEYISLHEHAVNNNCWPVAGRDNCWWDIDHDFIIFFGAIDRAQAMSKAIENTYNNTWCKLSDKDKESIIRYGYIK